MGAQGNKARENVVRRAGDARAALGLLLVAALAASSRAAHASGLLNPFVGDAHGQPELANPYAAYFNPAALGGITGTQLLVDGTLTVGYVRFDRTAPLSPSPANTPASPNYALYGATNTGTNTAVSAGGIPFLGASSDFGSKVFFGGLALYAPFGGAIDWNKSSRWANDAKVPGAVDGPQRWQSISVADSSLATTAVVGARLAEQRLSFGVGVTTYLHSVSLTKAFNSDGSDDVTAPNGGLKEGRVLLNVSGVDFGASAGVYWEADADRRIRIGASYTSQPGFGSMRLKGTLEQRVGVTPSGTTDVDLLQSYPDLVRLGIAYRVSDAIDLRLHGQFVRWSVFKDACVVHSGQPCDLNADGSAPKGQTAIIANVHAAFNDAYAIHAGVGYWPAKRVEIFVDAGVDSSAVPVQSLGVSLFDSFKIIGGVGLRYQVSDHLMLAGSYTEFYYLPVTVTGQVEAPAPSDVPVANGSYASHLMFANANATVAF
jgi:long-subunit fatty acid transport protein